ncbi:MAG: hypothetical protein M1546_22350 [Chloroflexi bacterium]|nr:hypothetical protein [Chloroflexota bacterium]
MDKYYEIKLVFTPGLDDAQADTLIGIVEANNCMTGGGGDAQSAEYVVSGERLVSVIEAVAQVVFAAAAGKLPAVRLVEADIEEGVEDEQEGQPA